MGLRITAFDNFPPIRGESTYSWSFTVSFASYDTSGVRWFNVFVFILTPVIGFAGFWLADYNNKTMAWSILYYIFSMLGK